MTWDSINRRRALVWGTWSLILLLGLWGLVVWHSNHAYEAALQVFAAEVGSPDHRDYVAEPVPDAENAALAFVAASEDLGVGPQWTRILEPAVWSAETQLLARGLLADNREALEDLRLASELTRCVWPNTTTIDGERLLPVLRAARLLRLDGFLAVVDGDPLGVKRAFRVLGHLADCLYAAPHLVGALLAASVERTQLEVVHAVVSSPLAKAPLLDGLRLELESRSQIDRVARTVAVEGAYALRLLAERPPEGALQRFLFRSVLFKRMSSTLALRWTELASWSRGSLTELAGAPAPPESRSRSMAGMLADLATTNVRHAIVRLRANRALIDLARLATEGRLHGLGHGDYDGALEDRAGLTVLEEGDGSVVLIDQPLEALLRDQLTAGDSTLELTVWRLPPPDRQR